MTSDVTQTTRDELRIFPFNAFADFLPLVGGFSPVIDDRTRVVSVGFFNR